MKKMIILALFACFAFGFDTNFKTFSSDFVQSVSNAQSKIDYTGSFVLTQDKAFWDYKTPNNKQIYIKNKDIIILEPDLEQAILSKLDQIPNLSEIFKNAKKQDESTYSAKYQQILYTIKLENGEISSISYKDDLDNSVTIKLFHQKRDFALDESVFEAKIPSHYDILK